jgi:thymidylate synthase
MLVLSADSVNELFVAACSAVAYTGKPVAPRGIPTREILGAHLRLKDPQRRLVNIPPARILNPAFAVAEAMWILSGSDDSWIHDYNDSLRQFTDDGVLMGAYGPRMRRWDGQVDQLDQVRQLLLRDPDSRQAVIQLFNPSRDFRGHRDVPCTLGYRFYLREGRLHMHTTMRSQDLWLGFGYDVFAATLLQELLAGWLGVQLGEYHHHVDSLHLYETVLDDVARLPTMGKPGECIPAPASSWSTFDTELRRLPTDLSVGDEAWAEYASVLESYRQWKAGDRDAARRTAAASSGVLARSLGDWYDHLQARASSSARVGK